jgi:hypothetical protein
VLFHQGAPALGAGTLRTEQGVAALREAAAHLSPAGQLQVATALEVLEALEARMHVVRHQLLGAPRGAVYSCGDGRAPPLGRRSGLVKLEAA